jgi:hypothetical protein
MTVLYAISLRPKVCERSSCTIYQLRLRTQNLTPHLNFSSATHASTYCVVAIVIRYSYRVIRTSIRSQNTIMAELNVFGDPIPDDADRNMFVMLSKNERPKRMLRVGTGNSKLCFTLEYFAALLAIVLHPKRHPRHYCRWPSVQCHG